MGQMTFITNSANPSPNTCPKRTIIWRPGGVESCDVVTTWAEVAAHIAATEGSITILVDGSLISPAVPTIPPGTDVECFGRATFAAYTLSTANFSAVLMADGARLRNLAQVQSMALVVEPGVSGIVPLLLDLAGTELIVRNGGRIELGAPATISAIEVVANACVLASFEGGIFQNSTGNPALAVIDIDPAVTQMIHVIISASGTFLPFNPPYGPTLFSGGGVGTTLVRIWDSSAPPVAQPLYLGGYFDLPLSNAIGTVYQDALVTPATGATQVQALLDILKRRVTGAGNTASRPAIPADIDTGGMYFDTDLGYPVWSNGAVYVDATGTPA